MTEREHMSDEELSDRCILAIDKDQSRFSLLKELRAENKKISETRLNKIWAIRQGPLQFTDRKKKG